MNGVIHLLIGILLISNVAAGYLIVAVSHSHHGQAVSSLFDSLAFLSCSSCFLVVYILMALVAVQTASVLLFGGYLKEKLIGIGRACNQIQEHAVAAKITMESSRKNENRNENEAGHPLKFLTGHFHNDHPCHPTPRDLN